MTLHEYLKKAEICCKEQMDKYPFDKINPTELRVGTTEYFFRGGKRLRPAILMLCAGAMGGESAEISSIPSACAVELFHTFTLVHDDIIDNDSTRRGGKSVHVLVADMFPEAECEKRNEYGRDTAILAGDMLHAISARLVLQTAKNGISPETVMAILDMLEGECLSGVLEGEAVDTRAGLITDTSLPFTTGTSEGILDMMQKKTGVLFSFAAKAGAMIGLDTPDKNNPTVTALGEFASECGIAFQLYDDILGIIADEKKLGKPIGSDIREGKRTLILQYAYESASESDKKAIEKTVGDKNATEEQILAVRDIFVNSGAVEKTRCLALGYIDKALNRIKEIPASPYLEILKEWANFMAKREL